MCGSFGEPEGPFDVIVDDTVGEIQSSGIAASRAEDGVYYTHDDQGGPAFLYVFRDDGTFVGGQNISGASNTDWEDVAPGPCPDSVDAESCLWIGDIGEGDGTRTELVLWVVPASTNGVESAVACRLVYPEGKTFDAETLLVGPDRTVRIVTKEDDGAKVFRISDPACDGGAAQTLTKEAELALSEKVTGGAISADGAQVVLRGLSTAWMWSGCSLNWSDAPTVVDLGEQPQGEAVTFANDGTLVTTSEVSNADEPLRYWRTPCEATTPLTCPTCGCEGEGEGAVLFLLFPLAGLARRRRATSRLRAP